MATAIRLQKYLANRGLCSRRQAEGLILQGQVAVNGQVITQLGTCVDPDQDLVLVAGKPLAQPQRRYILLHKPLGVVSTCFDPQGRPTVLSLLPESLRAGLYPVGRLDQDSQGALLLTNDGDLTFKLTHPAHEFWKVYRVWVLGSPCPQILKQWQAGVMLEGQRTLPAKVRKIRQTYDQTLLEIHIREGRNRQIRKIAASLGYPVQSLLRIALGPVRLGDLPLGHYRTLAYQELQTLLTSL